MQSFEWGARTYIMGIINVTPDSFSGDGVTDVDAAVAQALRFVDEGADILDVGGESTRPGSTRIDAELEIRRVVPVIERLAARVQVPISVDTSRAVVAQRALDAGATWINDVWALARDADLAPLVAASKAYVVLMHNREAQAVVGNLGGHYGNVQYENADIVQAVLSALAQRAAAAERANIAREKIIIDPGIGFGKGLKQNLELLRRLHEFKTHPALRDLPLLIGTSRKSVVGLTLNLPVQDRLEGTLATLALSIAQGADIVRVHDVRAAVRCCRVADAIVREGK
ncbi:MAG: dihydropteroate synthase [Chloroflexi bacterium]|nr:dihydropteroate synthase [Chloroflexota bacterium]